MHKAMVFTLGATALTTLLTLINIVLMTSINPQLASITIYSGESSQVMFASTTRKPRVTKRHLKDRSGEIVFECADKLTCHRSILRPGKVIIVTLPTKASYSKNSVPFPLQQRYLDVCNNKAL